MPRKMKEEKELRKYCNDICSRGDIPGVVQQAAFSEKITDLIRAVREDKESECIPYRGGKTPKGYPLFHYREDGKCKSHMAHRVAYTLYVGIIPKGMLVCHSCDNPACINPKHLFLGSEKDNYEDARSKKRNTRGVKIWNSKLNEETVNELRERYWIKKEPIKSLAKYFNMNRNNVSEVARGLLWKHIPFTDQVVAAIREGRRG